MGRSTLLRFLARRLGLMAIMLLVVSMVAFGLVYVAPGSVEQALTGGKNVSPETLDAIRARYNLDGSVFAQYWTWLTNAVQLDLGTSIRTNESVLDGLLSRWTVTLQLALYGFLLAVCAGVPLGVLAAVHRGTGIDRGAIWLAVLGISTPAFASGIALLILLSVEIPLFPTIGAGDGGLDRIWHLTLPAVALALMGMALIVRVTRAAMIAALEQDYIVFARARGLPWRYVLVRYGLRNALVPIITASGLILAAMMGGVVLVEVTFSIPGLGQLLVESVNFQDVPMVQGSVLVAAASVIAINLIADVLYSVVDPRIRLGQ